MNKQIFAGASALVAAIVLSACGGGQSSDSLNAQDHSQSMKSAAPGTIAQDNSNRISANGNFVVAVDNKGAVYTWGDNGANELYGSTRAINADTPMLVPTLSGIQSVKTGVYHSVALTADGRVVTWGNSSGAVLGTGTTATAGAPTQVEAMSGIKAIAAGNGHTEALHANGNVWGWGTIGNLNQQIAPQLVAGLSNMKAISGAGNFLVALRNDGTLWGVGTNTYGQLGTGVAINATATSAVQIAGIANVQAVAVGANHVLAMTTDGSIYAWGSNMSGQLAQPLTTHYNATPQKIANLKASTSIFAGDNNSGAIYTTGKVVTWGNGATGALGDGKTETGSVIVPATMVAAQAGVGATFGANSVYLIQQDGSVISSGSNAQGQLGTGNYSSHYTTVNVAGVNGVAQLRLGIAQ